MKVQELVNILASIAPLPYQENYDNSGLLTGDVNAEITQILVTLDCTEAVLDEAIEKGCNVVVAHHPIIFSGLKKIIGRNYVERTVIKAIKNDIAIYAIHTNYDNVSSGVNAMICERLGILNAKILQPKKQLLRKLSVFVPESNYDAVAQAVFQTGAGHIGNYSETCFRSSGIGSFRGNEHSNPTIGKAGEVEQVAEIKFETVFPAFLEEKIVNAIRKLHVYEEPAFDIYPLENAFSNIGSGMIGELTAPIKTLDFLKSVKEKMQAGVVRYTPPTREKVQKIAVCGGSGRFLLSDAIAAGADVFITADFKYHEFFDAENHIVIADIGHYESEQFTKDLLKRHLLEKNPTFAVLISEINTNPVNYL